MGKGQSQKRRIKNAAKANEGNLLKASFRKASKHLPLPDAPTKQDFEEKLPASLRKLQALKSLAEKGGNKKFQQFRPQARPQPSGTKGNAPSDSSQHPTTDHVAKAHVQPTPAAPSTSAPALKAGQDAPMPYQAPQKTTSKDRKKQYLRMKDKRLKDKGRKKGQGELMTEKEREMFLKSKDVKFGEQADAPPTVNLKRKHWDPEAAEKKASTRCKEVFMKQMQEAERNSMLMAGTDSGLHLKRQRLKESEREDVRQQVIDAYRLKRQKGQSSAATVDSLAKLVKRNAA